jgi:fengycin family lipopeptide synthetase D
MAIFVTGSTGYLGSYLVAGLLTGHRDRLNLLVRAKTEREARERLWASLQLHLEFPEFFDYLNTRVQIFRGDLTAAIAPGIPGILRLPEYACANFSR